jgi:hypothetical protein
MSDCKHPWKKIEAKADGIGECVECGLRWRVVGESLSALETRICLPGSLLTALKHP